MRRGLVYSLLFIILLAAGSLAATIAAGHTPLEGLDLKGGVSVVLQPQGTATGAELSEAVTIIDRRVNGLGVSNSQVARQGSDVVIDLPGIKNSQQALAQLGQTAVLYFRPVLCTIPAYVSPAATTTTTVPGASTTTVAPKATPGTTVAPTSTPTTAKADGAPATARLTSVRLPQTGSTATTTAPATVTTTAAGGSTTTTTTPASSSANSSAAATAAVAQSACQSSNASTIPSTPIAQDVGPNSVILPVDPKAFGSSALRYVLGPADLTGAAISDAAAEVNTTTGQYSVSLTLNGKGAATFDNFAASRYACYKQNPSNPPYCALEAFELDGLVESAPDFQAASFNGSVQISGNFTSSQANNLANELKYGSLPVRFVPQSVQTVSATIGKDSLRAGILAGIGGIVVVLLYILLYYRALGLVVVAGILVGGSILYSLITELGQTSNFTLTLAGITGIIVSVGITVDSYIVYFERLKDEVRAGRTVRQSVERSFNRAFRTVLTADLVSLMAAAILYFLTIGDVKGFAATLAMSTILDVFTAYFFIRPAVILVGRRRSIVDNQLFGISRGLGARTRTREV